MGIGFRAVWGNPAVQNFNSQWILKVTPKQIQHEDISSFTSKQGISCISCWFCYVVSGKGLYCNLPKSEQCRVTLWELTSWSCAPSLACCSSGVPTEELVLGLGLRAVSDQLFDPECTSLFPAHWTLHSPHSPRTPNKTSCTTIRRHPTGSIMML